MLNALYLPRDFSRGLRYFHVNEYDSRGRIDMRVFLTACLAIVILAVGGYFAVNAMQQPSAYAFTTEGARIDPTWACRDC